MALATAVQYVSDLDALVINQFSTLGWLHSPRPPAEAVEAASGWIESWKIELSIDVANQYVAAPLQGFPKENIVFKIRYT